MTQVLNDSQLEFDLGDGEKATDVSFDRPEGDESPAAPEPEAKIFQKPEQEEPPAKNELDEISEGVQKRISKLTARMREAERREQAALEYAKGLQTQAQSLQQKLVQTDYSRLNEAKTRLETQQTQLRQIIAKAREENDINTELEAQERLSALVGEQRQVAGWLQTQQETIKQQREAPVQQAPVQQAQQRPAPSPQAEEWAEKNPWFGQDRVMTYAAWGIHQTLVEQEGVDPSSDEYYTELDRRVRSTFPDKFKDQSRQQRSAPAVAPAARSSGINSARRTVRLSPSQVAIAKKLGVPLEEYAKYVKE